MRDGIAAATAVTADPASSYLAIRAGAIEAHPLWGWLIGHVGLAPAMIVRALAGLVLIAALVVAIEHEDNPLTGWTLRALAVVFAAIVVWNLTVWLTAA